MIGDLSKVWLVANAREDDAPRLHVGDPVEVRVAAFPGKVFKARLTFVASSIDANTHRLPVRAEVENPDGALKPEMFARFRIITGADVTAPAVPEQAIVYEGEDTHVWLADPEGENAGDQAVQGRPHQRRHGGCVRRPEDGRATSSPRVPCSSTAPSPAIRARRNR